MFTNIEFLSNFHIFISAQQVRSFCLLCILVFSSCWNVNVREINMRRDFLINDDFSKCAAHVSFRTSVRNVCRTRVFPRCYLGLFLKARVAAMVSWVRSGSGELQWSAIFAASKSDTWFRWEPWHQDQVITYLNMIW